MIKDKTTIKEEYKPGGKNRQVILDKAVKFITFRLEEMERNTFAMLKTVKRKMEEREKNVEAEIIAN